MTHERRPVLKCEQCETLEEKLREAIITYTPYVKALKEQIAIIEAERDKALEDLKKLKIEVESWRRIAAI